MSVLACGCLHQHPHEHVTRLDRALQQYASMLPDDRDSIMRSLLPEAHAFFKVLGYDSLNPSDVEAWSQSDVVNVFQPDVDSMFGDLDILENQIAHMRTVDENHHWGLTDNVRFAAAVWGRPQPIVRCDSVMLIALNHYLGKGYPGYSHWEYYRRKDKVPEQIPYDLAGALAATKHPFDTRLAPTLLSWMLYEGALMHARMMLVDRPKLSTALGYSPEELQYLESNTQSIWDDMRIMRVIYTTDPATIDRFIAPAPTTPLINHNVPGRAGRYIGYKIVESYIKNHAGATLDFLLSPQFYDTPQSLIDSGF